MLDWQLVIPMSGHGQRFLNAGYSDPKPLIAIHGHPMIAWVLKMFPGIEDITFICQAAHLDNTPMRHTLKLLAPRGKIVETPTRAAGPTAALLAAEAVIDDNRPVLVSYCDYYMHWDMLGFVKKLAQQPIDGAIPCYTGFHPHLLPKQNLYAVCRTDAADKLLEIREKHTFTDDKTASRHSPGVYYFQRGDLLKHYAKEQIATTEGLQNEYYVSLIYPLMLKDNKTILAPNCVQSFCQWGTPEDLAEYRYWTKIVNPQAVGALV